MNQLPSSGFLQDLYPTTLTKSHEPTTQLWIPPGLVTYNINKVFHEPTTQLWIPPGLVPYNINKVFHEPTTQLWVPPGFVTYSTNY